MTSGPGNVYLLSSAKEACSANAEYLPFHFIDFRFIICFLFLLIKPVSANLWRTKNKVLVNSFIRDGEDLSNQFKII